MDPNAPENQASIKLQQLQQAMALSYYQRNGLFDDNEKGWESLGVKQGNISGRTIPPSEIAWHPDTDFMMLQEMCTGRGGISELQPAQAERQRGTEHFNRLVDDYATQRMALIDEIWDIYAAHLVENDLDEVEKQAKEAAENAMTIVIELPFETPQEERDAQNGKGMCRSEA